MDTNSKFEFSVSNDEKSLSTLLVNVGKSAYDEAVEKQINTHKPKIAIKGFRTGHAPREIILSKYRKSLELSAEEEIVESAWALYEKENNIKTLGTPKITDVKRNDSGFSVTYQYYKMPEFEVPDLRSISIQKDSYVVDEKSVELAYELYTRRFADFEDSELPAEIGDKVSVSVNFELESNKAINQELEVVVSAGDKFTLYSTSVIGMKKGDSVTIKTFVDDIEAVAVLSVLKVKKPKPSEEIDEEAVLKMKQTLKEHLMERAENRSLEQFHDVYISDAFASAVNIDIPKGYFDEQVNRSWQELERAIVEQGSSMRQYLASFGKTSSSLRADYEKIIDKKLKFDIGITRVADQNRDSIIPSEDVIKENANKMYEYHSYMGMDNMSGEEHQHLVEEIMQEAQRIAIFKAILDFVQANVNIVENPSVPFIPKQDDVFFGY